MKIKNILNKKFGRLLVIDHAVNPGTRKNDTAAYWKCICDCGKEKVIRGYSLTSGKTKSCGCLNNECSQLDIYKLPKLDYQEAIAKNLWRRGNRYIDVPFKEFMDLIQQPCFYCKSYPKLVNYGRRNVKQSFYHGTLDRVDSKLGHTIDNVVPCCVICNRAKLDRTMDDFKNYINKIKNNTLIDPILFKNNIPNKSMYGLNKQTKVAVKIAYNFYKNNKPGKLTLEQFYKLSSSNCYYCSTEPSNTRKYYKAEYKYNGLDRIDNSKGHSYENVVPCCKWCNSAKNNLTLQDFLDWTKLFYNFF